MSEGDSNEETKEFIKAADNGGKIMIHVTMWALDNMYCVDVCACATFGKGCIHFGTFFEDMLEPVQGRPAIDWNKLNNLKWKSATARTLDLRNRHVGI